MRREPPETKSPPLGLIASGQLHSKRRYVGWRKHGTKDWQIIFTLTGDGRFTTAEGNLDVGDGDVVLLQPGVTHNYGAPAGSRHHWSACWVHFLPREAWLPWLRWPEFAPGILHLKIPTPELRALLRGHFASLARYSFSPVRHADAFAQTILQEIILHCDTCNPRLDEPLLDARVRRAVDFLSENLAKPLRLPQLAKYCGLSVSRFSHLFRAETGKSPGHYHEDLRMSQAVQSLRHSDQRINTIANALGYDDPLYFSNRFRRYTGLSPRAFRTKEFKGYP